MTKSFKYFDLILAAFAVTLVVSNIASTKLATLNFPLIRTAFDGGTFLFPLTYIFGDVLTEVYGYKRARRAIWFGLFANLFTALILAGVTLLPSSPDGFANAEFGKIFGFVPQIVLASTVAFFVGEFLNSYVLAKLKIFTQGKMLWTRTIGSTLVGQAADTIIFSVIAFGIGQSAVPRDVLWGIIAFNYIYKVALEVILTPVTYAAVRTLKRAEQEDYYDTGTNFSPFVK